MNISCHENYTDQIIFYNQKLYKFFRNVCLTKKMLIKPQPHEGNYQKVDFLCKNSHINNPL